MIAVAALALLAAALVGVHVGWSTVPEIGRLHSDVTDLSTADTELATELHRLQPARGAHGRFTRKA